MRSSSKWTLRGTSKTVLKGPSKIEDWEKNIEWDEKKMCCSLSFLASSRSINLRSTNWTCPHWHVSLVVVSLPVPHLTAPTYYSYSEGNRRSEPWHESWSSNGSTGINCNVNKLRYDNADAGHENQRSFRVKQAMSCCFNLPWGELM